MAGRVERVRVQERIARAVGQSNEPEALLRIEPLDRRVVLRAEAGGGRPRLHWPRHVPWRRAIEGEIVIEAAAPGRASTSAVVHIQETVVLMTIGVAHVERKSIASIDPGLASIDISIPYTELKAETTMTMRLGRPRPP
jgi:hypothetical protein